MPCALSKAANRFDRGVLALVEFLPALAGALLVRFVPLPVPPSPAHSVAGCLEHPTSAARATLD